MATRQTYFAESNGESTTTSDSDQDKTTLTFTPDASSDYFLLWCALLSQQTGTTSDARAKLVNSTAATTLGSVNFEPKDITDYLAVGSVAMESFGASPTSQTYKIQYSVETAATTTAGIKEARILAIKAGADDEYAASDGTSSTTSATPQDKTTLTFTPASQGDYILIASAEMSCDGTSTTIGALLDVDGTDYAVNDFRVGDTTSWISWGAVKRVNLTAASHTIKIQYNSAGGAVNANIRNARIIALRADAFEANYYAEDTGRDTLTGSTSYTDEASLTQTPAAKEHVILASALFNYSTTIRSGYCQILEGASVKGESIREPVTAAATNHFLYWTFYRATLAASSTTWKFQMKASNAGDTVAIDEQAISVIQVEGSSAVVIAGPMQDLMGGFAANYGGQGFIDPGIQKIEAV